MAAIVFKRNSFVYEDEYADFVRLFSFLDRTLGAGAFVKYRGQIAVGALAPAYYEAVSLGVLNALPKLLGVSAERLKETIIRVVQSPDFRDFTGPGANSRPKLDGRIRSVQEALEGLAQ